jgi:hypothetical protein
MDQDFTLFSFVLAHPRFRRDGRKAVENRRRKNCTERLDETLARVECGVLKGQGGLMNMKPCVWAALAIATGGLVACADTGPMQIGKDTYSISVRVPLSGPSGAKGQALREAARPRKLV